ncbi:MAG: PAS-domain containing protein [Alphaproteobacteria bacterium]|nr:PAS-domain containing protein [Alphaproteobacteria bacterium SS10]
MTSFIDISATTSAYDADRHSAFERLDQWRLRTHYSNLPFTLTGLTLGSIIAVIAFWPYFEPSLLVGWLCVHAAMIGYRSHYYLTFRETGITVENIAHWRRQAILGTIAAGLVWSAAVILLMPPLELPGRMLLTFLIGGFSAAAVGITSVYLPSLYAWILTAQITVTLGTFATADDQTGYSMAVMMTFFTVALLFFGNSSSRSMRQSYIDASRQAALRSEVSMLEARTRSALEHMPAAVALFDQHDRLAVWNRQATVLFPELHHLWRAGSSFTDLAEASHSWRSLGPAHMESHDPVADRLAVHEAPGTSWEVAVEDGRWLQAQEARMPDGGYLTIYIDISSLKREEQVLRAAKEDAERASQAKSQFLALMSHELRTPLNAILGFAQGIENRQFGDLDDHYVEYGAVIRESGEHLLSVINDILDLSKIEAGHMTLAPEKLDPGRSLQSAKRILKEKAIEAQLTVTLKIERKLPAFHADPRAVHQMLLNLMANAIKFTPSGGTITLESIRRGEELVLAVSDTGIGIAPEDIEAVLQPFVQVDDTLRRREQGTGLGVPLTKSLIELHGGRLEIESVVGKGTRMALVFPPSCLDESAAKDRALSLARL